MVEQKTGIFFVLSTPLIELPIQKTLKKTKNCSSLQRKKYNKNEENYKNHEPIAGSFVCMNRKGGAQVFDDYIDTYGRRLFGLCMHLCRNYWDAQDLYQETWLKAYKSRQRYDDSRDFGLWLSRICVNLYRDRLRRKKLLSFLPFSSQEQEESPVHQLAAPEPEDYTDLYHAVKQLPEVYRLVIVLYYFLGCSVGQTAEVLNIPAGTVKSRLSKARSLLERSLDDDG